MVLNVKRLRSTARLPERATEGSAGYDLRACIEDPVTIPPGESRPITTGLAIALPGPDCAALIYARSGLASKHGVAPSNCVGVVDSDYRGEMVVNLRNFSARAYVVNDGDRIAQLVVTPVLHPEFTECAELDDTVRGTGGFGSTGKN